MIQGQSQATIDKERRIGAALAVTMKIVAAKFGSSRYNYFHLDCNAGSGWNEEVNVPGSPAVFWRLAAQYLPNMPLKAFFAEIDSTRAAALLRAVPTAHQHCSFIFPHDNAEVIEVFAEFIRSSRERAQHVMGSILIDPNGYFYRGGVPVEGLRQFVREFPKIDLILNLNSRTYQLQRGKGHNVQSPREILQSLGKKFWLVGEARPGGHRFLLAVGRNFDPGEHRAVGLYDWNSEEGRYILNSAEGRRQGSLFDAAV